MKFPHWIQLFSLLSVIYSVTHSPPPPCHWLEKLGQVVLWNVPYSRFDWLLPHGVFLTYSPEETTLTVSVFSSFCDYLEISKCVVSWFRYDGCKFSPLALPPSSQDNFVTDLCFLFQSPLWFQTIFLNLYMFHQPRELLLLRTSVLGWSPSPALLPFYFPIFVSGKF